MQRLPVSGRPFLSQGQQAGPWEAWAVHAWPLLTGASTSPSAWPKHAQATKTLCEGMPRSLEDRATMCRGVTLYALIESAKVVGKVLLKQEQLVRKVASQPVRERHCEVLILGSTAGALPVKRPEGPQAFAASRKHLLPGRCTCPCEASVHAVLVSVALPSCVPASCLAGQPRTRACWPTLGLGRRYGLCRPHPCALSLCKLRPFILAACLKWCGARPRERGEGSLCQTGTYTHQQ